MTRLTALLVLLPLLASLADAGPISQSARMGRRSVNPAARKTCHRKGSMNHGGQGKPDWAEYHGKGGAGGPHRGWQDGWGGDKGAKGAEKQVKYETQIIDVTTTVRPQPTADPTPSSSAEPAPTPAPAPTADTEPFPSEEEETPTPSEAPLEDALKVVEPEPAPSPAPQNAGEPLPKEADLKRALNIGEQYINRDGEVRTVIAVPHPRLKPQLEYPKANTPDGWVEAHNLARSQFGSAPVTWSEGAFQQARDNVETRKAECRRNIPMKGQSSLTSLMSEGHQRRKYGENLVWGSGGNGNSGPDGAMPMWMDEAKNWNYTDPNHQTADLGTWGHFTPIVWKDLKGIGCAVAGCDNGGTLIACCYDGGVNMGGQYAKMVPEPL